MLTHPLPTRWIGGLTWAVTGVVLLTGCQVENGPEDEGSPSPTDIQTTPTTLTETDSVAPTEAVSPTATTSPADGATTRAHDPARDLLVTPQQPLTAEPGDDVEFAVAGRLGDPEAGTPVLVGFGWLPCDTVDATRPGTLTFPDGGDGETEQMGTSNTGSARLHSVNGERYENVDDRWPVALHTTDQAPPLQVTMRSNAADCATLVFFLDEDGDEELDLDEDGTATEVYGVAEANWEA